MSHMMVCGFSIIMRTHAMCARQNNEIKNIVVLYQLSLIQFRETQHILCKDTVVSGFGYHDLRLV